MNNSNSKQEQNFFDDEISLKDLFQSLKKVLNKIKPFYKYIFFSIFFGMIIGYIIFKRQKILYKAEINFVLEEPQGAGSGGLASQLGLSIGGQKSNIFSGETFFAFMKSRFLLEKTLLSPVVINNEEISLIEFYIRSFGLRNKDSNSSNFIFKPYQDRHTFTLKQVQFLNSIQSQIASSLLEVKPKDKKTSILTIEVLSENEQFSKIFCERISEVASEFYVETLNKKARINLEILEKQTDSIKKELILSMNDAALSFDKTYNINPSKLVNKVPSSRKQIDVQANSGILSQLINNLENARVSFRKETPLIQIIDSPILPLDIIQENIYKYLIYGSMAGFFISTLLIFILIKFKEYFNLN